MPTWGEWEYLSRPSRSKGFDMVWLKHIFSPWFDASDAALLCVVLRLLLSLKFGPMSLSVKRSNSWADQIWGQKNTVEALPITLPSKPLGCKKLAHNFSTKLSLFAKKKNVLVNQPGAIHPRLMYTIDWPLRCNVQNNYIQYHTTLLIHHPFHEKTRK